MSGEGVTVLLTGVGLDGGPDIIRALRADTDLRARVVGVDSSPDQAGRHLSDAFALVPPRDDPGYVDAVTGIAEREGARVIYPLPTFDQEIFAAARAELRERGFAVPVSGVESVRTCNDKLRLYRRLQASVPETIPATRRVASAAELTEAAREFGYPKRRVCIRRRISRGAIGLRLLDRSPARLEALLSENPGTLLISLDEVLDVLGQAEEFPEYLVQEYLPGGEWDVDALCRDGEAVAVVTRRNLGMAGGAATRSVLEPSERIASLSRRIIRELELEAVVNVAFRPDKAGDPKLLEINPRIPQSILAGLGGGVNLVALAVRQALGESVEPVEPRWGGEFIRHFQSVVTDGSGTAVIGS
jgi:predicted ATP-grasp superfamily ATP-dependent carboligase